MSSLRNRGYLWRVLALWLACTLVWPARAHAVTVDVTVATSTDDATESNTGTTSVGNATSGVIDATNEYYGARFVIAIPAGATVTAAYATFDFPTGTLDEPQGTIYAHDSATPATFTDGVGNTNISSRTSTTATVSFDVADAGTGDEQTPSLVSIIQELVDSYGGSMTHIALIYQGGADGNRDFSVTMYDGTPSISGRLHVEYTESGGGGDPVRCTLALLGAGKC